MIAMTNSGPFRQPDWSGHPGAAVRPAEARFANNWRGVALPHEIAGEVTGSGSGGQ